MVNETYLGDGLYAEFDGHRFILRAPRDDGDHWVALGPEELELFLEFANEKLEQANLKLKLA